MGYENLLLKLSLVFDHILQETWKNKESQSLNVVPMYGKLAFKWNNSHTHTHRTYKTTKWRCLDDYIIIPLCIFGGFYTAIVPLPKCNNTKKREAEITIINFAILSKNVQNANQIHCLTSFQIKFTVKLIKWIGKLHAIRLVWPDNKQ